MLNLIRFLSKFFYRSGLPAGLGLTFSLLIFLKVDVYLIFFSEHVAVNSGVFVVPNIIFLNISDISNA